MAKFHKSPKVAQSVTPAQIANAVQNDSALPTTAVLPSVVLAAATEVADAIVSTKKAKRAPIIRITHPDLSNGKKLTAYPISWSSIYHKALTKDDFESEVVYLLAQADYYDRRAKDLREQAEDVKNNGGSETTKAIKKVRKVINELPSLLAGVAGKGVDLAQLLEALKAMQTAQTAPTAETTETAVTA